MKNYVLEILDNVDVIIYVSDIQTYEILYINEYTRKLFGDIEGHICWKFLQKGQNGPCSFCTNDKIVTSDGKPTGVYHWEFQNTITGQWFDIRDTAIEWEDGRIVRLEIATDITKHKYTEETLKEREQYLQSIINTEPECVKIVFSDGTLMQMNPAGLKMIEADSFDQVKGKCVYNIVGPKYRDAFRELTESVCLGNQGSLEFEIIGLKGTHRWLETHAVPLRNAQSEIIGLLGVTRDITEHRKALEEIKQLNEELEQVLYVTSHDLRSPLVNISGYSKELFYSIEELMSTIENERVPSSIKEKITPILKDYIPESLHYIQISVAKMETLLKAILTLSRLGRYELTIEEIDMNTMITDIVDNHRFRLNELRIKTEVSELPNCKGDSIQINQVFSNLLDNAIKYLDSERSCVINISGYKDKNQSVYCVEDNGIGIAPEHLDKIFEIFYQLEPHKFKGEGMGLTIVNKILEKHGGKIWIESELGKGSKFFVSLPS